MKRIAILILGGALLAGCGSGSGAKAPAPYSMAATNSCVTAPRNGIKVSHKVDFVASTATRGAEQLHFAQNDVTLLFGQDANEANNLADAYRRFRAKNVGIEDILRVKNNVVMLWRLHPLDEYQATLESCLR